MRRINRNPIKRSARTKTPATTPATTPPVVAESLEPEPEVESVGAGVWSAAGVLLGVGVAEPDVVTPVLVVVSVVGVGVVVCEVVALVLMVLALVVVVVVDMSIAGGWFSGGQIPPL